MSYELLIVTKTRFPFSVHWGERVSGWSLVGWCQRLLLIQRKQCIDLTNKQNQERERKKKQQVVWFLSSGIICSLRWVLE